MGLHKLCVNKSVANYVFFWAKMLITSFFEHLHIKVNKMRRTLDSSLQISSQSVKFHHYFLCLLELLFEFMRTVHMVKGSHANETLMIIFVLYVKSLSFWIIWYYLFAFFFFNPSFQTEICHEGRSCICGRVFRQFGIVHFTDVPKHR